MLPITISPQMSRPIIMDVDHFGSLGCKKQYTHLCDVLNVLKGKTDLEQQQDQFNKSQLVMNSCTSEYLQRHSAQNGELPNCV